MDPAKEESGSLVHEPDSFILKSGPPEYDLRRTVAS